VTSLPDRSDLRRLPTYDACFGCGDDNPHGLGVDFYTDGKSVWCEWTPHGRFTGYEGIVHGGVLSTLIDETMGWASYVGSGLMGKTAELTIRYLHSVPIGEPVLVRAWMVENRRDRIVHVAAEMTGTEGRKLMRAQAKFMPLTAEETRTVDGYLNYHEGPPLEYRNK